MDKSFFLTVVSRDISGLIKDFNSLIKKASSMVVSLEAWDGRGLCLNAVCVVMSILWQGRKFRCVSFLRFVKSGRTLIICGIFKRRV